MELVWIDYLASPARPDINYLRTCSIICRTCHNPKPLKYSCSFHHQKWCTKSSLAARKKTKKNGEPKEPSSSANTSSKWAQSPHSHSPSTSTSTKRTCALFAANEAQASRTAWVSSPKALPRSHPNTATSSPSSCSTRWAFTGP